MRLPRFARNDKGNRMLAMIGAEYRRYCLLNFDFEDAFKGESEDY
jgi:hypothetical protein